MRWFKRRKQIDEYDDQRVLHYHCLLCGNDAHVPVGMSVDIAFPVDRECCHRWTLYAVTNNGTLRLV